MKTTGFKHKFNMAFDLANIVHFGQTDLEGRNYIYHPIRVSKIVEQFCKNRSYDKDFTWKCKIAALLHDVIEDSKNEDNKIYEGFPGYTIEELIEATVDNEEILDAVKHCTRLENESHFEYIKRCNECEISRIVKICDLKDNLDVFRRTNDLTDTDIGRLNKYIKWYNFLINEYDRRRKN